MKILIFSTGAFACRNLCVGIVHLPLYSPLSTTVCLEFEEIQNFKLPLFNTQKFYFLSYSRQLNHLCDLFKDICNISTLCILISVLVRFFLMLLY